MHEPHLGNCVSVTKTPSKEDSRTGRSVCLNQDTTHYEAFMATYLSRDVIDNELSLVFENVLISLPDLY